VFDSEARRERRLQRLQDQSNAYAERALGLWRTGRADEAVRPNQQAIDTIRQLRAEEPDNEQHLAQLAGKLYNHAGMLAQAGRLAEAVTAARECLTRYLELTGGEVSHEALMGDRLLSLSHSLRPTPRRYRLSELAAMTADAKSRLATLLARTDPGGGGPEARRLATQAVDTYHQLRDLEPGHDADVTRVIGAKAEVLRLLGGR
jgi:tetratricopeptide (TPR) repeat protein